MMKDVKYIIKKVIIGVAIGFSMFYLRSNVFAATVGGYSILGHNIDDEFTVASNGSITGPLSFYNTGGNSNSSSSFGYIDICTNGNEPTLWITSNTNGSIISSTSWFKVNVPCSISGVGYVDVYRQIFFIGNSSYYPTCSVSPDTSSVPCTANASTARLFSNTSYTTKMRILHFGITDAPYLQDLAYENDKTQTDILREILSTLTTSSTSQTQAIQEQTQKIQEQIDATEKVNETLNDDDTSSSTDDAGSFFNGFSTDTHGLTSIITAPLNLINSLTSQSCTPLTLPLPYVNKNLVLPCMSSIYSQYFGSFLTIYQTITFGIVSYWVVVRIFNMVKDFKNPDHDEIEVLDL